MRTISAASVVALAATIGHFVTSNYIVNVAIQNRYSYDDYLLLCKCLNRVPLAETKLVAQAQEHHQLSLEGTV